jgi:agmatinase
MFNQCMSFDGSSSTQSTIPNNPLHPLWNDSSDENSGLFGLPFDVENSSTVVVPAPWDGACSQGTGTCDAPGLILEQSRYLELHELTLGNIYERGIALAETSPEFQTLTDKAEHLHKDPQAEKLDRLCECVNSLVFKEVSAHIDADRSVGLLGGDHSVSYGSIMAHQDKFPEIGLLQIDAHADLRPSLDGMAWSHASVIHQVMESIPALPLTQVGIRAICSQELAYKNKNPRIKQFTDVECQRSLATGESWLSICDRVIETLPNQVYLTLDIDALEPGSCPNTGTPVPSGLSYAQLTILLCRVVESGRVLRGFDLVEVGGQPQDALIAAHLLYLLCGLVEDRRRS